MNIRRIGIIGAGTMGSGIAEVAAVAGCEVRLCDSAAGQVEKSRQNIRASLERAARRGKLPHTDIESVIARLSFQSTVAAVADCDFIIEAIVENLDAKRRLHAELGQIAKPEIVIASNTSSISITQLAEASGRPDRFVGMHFFNPAPIMPLVEVIRGRATSEETLAATESLARQFGKSPVRANDAPGFVANRVLMPLINEAVFALAEGVADAKSIDQIMVLGCNHPMGPLALADLIGLDVCLFILEVLERDIGNPKFAPCSLLRQMVAEGRLGKKSGRGFYEYP